MTKDELEAADFWDRAVCLECKEIVDATDDGECPECGATAIPAGVVLKCAELVEE